MTDVNLFADHSEDNTVDYLTELVGEGKKFKTVEDLAKGKAESDRFIAQLTKELEDARTEVQKRIALEDLKTAILERDNGGNRELVDTPPEKTNTIDANSIEELVRKQIEAGKIADVKASNEQKVAAKLAEVYGDNAREALVKASKELGYPVSKLGEIGSENPEALFKLLGVGNQPSPNGGTVPRSSVNREPSNSLTGERNKAYYDKLKTSDPKTYWDKRTQIQMNKDAIRLGERYFI